MNRVTVRQAAVIAMVALIVGAGLCALHLGGDPGVGPDLCLSALAVATVPLLTWLPTPARHMVPAHVRAVRPWPLDARTPPPKDGLRLA